MGSGGGRGRELVEGGREGQARGNSDHLLLRSLLCCPQFKPLDQEQDNGHPKVVLRGFMEVDKVEQGKHLFGGAW